MAFSLFAVDRSKETVQPARTPPVYLLASTVPLQISGALLIYLVHLIISAIVVFASLASSQLGVLCSLVVAVIVTLLSASFVFVLIEDADVEQRGLRGIRFAPRYIMRSVTVLRSSWREIARPATLLVAKMSNKRILGKRLLTDGAPILLRKQGTQELNIENAASSSGYRACSDTHKDTPMSTSISSQLATAQ